jgi:CO/xanthine dehydrogenase Mo-binding subunit
VTVLVLDMGFLDTVGGLVGSGLGHAVVGYALSDEQGEPVQDSLNRWRAPRSLAIAFNTTASSEEPMPGFSLAGRVGSSLTC